LLNSDYFSKEQKSKVKNNIHIWDITINRKLYLNRYKLVILSIREFSGSK
jgi:hypothetical protein